MPCAFKFADPDGVCGLAYLLGCAGWVLAVVCGI